MERYGLGDRMGGGQLGNETTENSNIPICISNIEGHTLKEKKIIQVEANINWTILLDNNNQYYVYGNFSK